MDWRCCCLRRRRGAIPAGQASPRCPCLSAPNWKFSYEGWEDDYRHTEMQVSAALPRPALPSVSRGLTQSHALTPVCVLGVYPAQSRQKSHAKLLIGLLLAMSLALWAVEALASGVPARSAASLSSDASSEVEVSVMEPDGTTFESECHALQFCACFRFSAEQMLLFGGTGGSGAGSNMEYVCHALLATGGHAHSDVGQIVPIPRRHGQRYRHCSVRPGLRSLRPAQRCAGSGAAGAFLLAALCSCPASCTLVPIHTGYMHDTALWMCAAGALSRPCAVALRLLWWLHGTVQVSGRRRHMIVLKVDSKRKPYGSVLCATVVGLITTELIFVETLVSQHAG